MTERPQRFRDLSLKPIYRASDDRLRSFYQPVLALAVRYDRMVGYWRSSSLAVAAAGVARFIRNAMEEGGQMRVIAGAQLTDADIRAIAGGEAISEIVERRLLSDELVAEDEIVRERLRILAWMVREGLLEIKVGIPTDERGNPLRPDETDRYFHTKVGILTDREGDRVAFIGSVNESAQGWRENHEMFSVYRSWAPGWEEYGQPLVEEFESHWVPGPLPGNWICLDLPQAVKERLVQYVPDDWIPPMSDPLEVRATASVELERIREAPRATPGGGVGLATLPFDPWPHQTQIATRIIDTWPRSYLLADEVGLGKTIEAGMVIREALLSGMAEKILLLVPASVQRQWQEELWEKFCLDVPRYENRKFYDVRGDEVTPPADSSPWDAFPVVLASSHLARMRAHRESVLASGPWDLVFVDEAHHARRRGSLGQEGANQLLQLLREMKQRERWKVLLLASATPMQMNTFELYDLLDLIGLPGSWGRGEEAFEFYYRQLAEPDCKARDWRRLRQMLADFFSQPEVGTNRIVERKLASLPAPRQWAIRKFHASPIPPAQLATWSPEEKQVFDQWLRAHTPVRDRVFRTTRVALHEYQRVGLLRPDATIPRRMVHDALIRFETEAEERLYQRIEDYISRYYQKYDKDKKTKPLGWIMTVYRRRLTSSLAAIHKSLVRRMQAIQGQIATDALLDEDDRYALEATDIDFDDLSEAALPYAEELEELKSFIGELEGAIPHDTKGRDVVDRIRRLFFGGSQSVVVFTQFTDTLEWLRDQLAAEYGDAVACYTGAGGSRWDRELRQWVRLDKEQVKELFRNQEIRILIGTDSMSEGLNLQTCDQLINYDMPWNFMRVEQRIGRIDRINGRPIVHITNYFYEGTVEEQVYSGIKEDAEWFQHVVGPAQPVLSQVEDVIKELALSTTGAQRQKQLEEELENVRMAIEEYQRRPLTLDSLEATEGIDDEVRLAPTMGLREIEETLLRNPLTAPRMHPHPDFPHTYLVEVGGEKHPMTFDREVYDGNPEIGFMTYGHPVFEALLRGDP